MKEIFLTSIIAIIVSCSNSTEPQLENSDVFIYDDNFVRELKVSKNDTAYIFKFAIHPDSSLRGEIFVEESGIIKEKYKSGGEVWSFSDTREYRFKPQSFDTVIDFKVEQWKYGEIDSVTLGVVDKWLVGEIKINY